jgi:hypothetical protein
MTISERQHPLATMSPWATLVATPDGGNCPSELSFEEYHGINTVSEKTPNITSLLEHASLILLEQNAISEQLGDPLARAKNGLVIPPSAGVSAAELPAVLTKILGTLNESKQTIPFYQWIDDEIQQGRNPQQLLTMLTTTTILFNSEQEIKNGEPPSHIFSLNNGLQIMYDRFYQKTGAHPNAENFNLLEDTRFLQLLLTTRFFALSEDRSIDLIDAALAQVHRRKISYDDLPASIVAYLKNAPKTLASICRASSQYSQEIYNSLEQEGRIAGVTEPTIEEQQLMCAQAIESIQSNMLKDVKDINFADKVPHGKKRMQVYYWPGTFGGMTEGHREGINTMVDYIKSENKRDPETWRIILVLPNITPGLSVEGTHKDVAQVGYPHERFSSVATTLWDADMDIVFVSTQLPNPALPVVHGRKRTKAALNSFATKVHDDLKKAGRPMQEEVIYTKFCGADKIYEQLQDGSYTLNMANMERFGPGTVVLTRPGYLQKALADAPIIVTKYGLTLIAKLSTHKDSSTRAIEEFHTTGDLSNFRVTTRPLIFTHWNEEAINVKAEAPPDLTTIPSITEVAIDLARTYPDLVKNYFRSITSN